MREFLYQKFSEFTPSELEQFQFRIAKALPRFVGLDPLSMSLRTWSQEEHGFWYCSPYEAYYFENTGIIHVLSAVRHKNYYQVCSTLHSQLDSNEFYVTSPKEYTTHVFNVTGHCRVPFGSTLSYMTFETPRQRYGTNLSFDLLMKRDKLYEVFVPYIDYIAWLLRKIKSNRLPFPEWIPINHWMRNTNYYFMAMLPNFSLSEKLCTAIYIKEITDLVNSVTNNNELANSIVEYARTSWTLPRQI